MAKKGLKTWFKENWVDISTGKKCGRKSAKSSKRKYPVCRPKAVANRMTAGQKAAAVKRKRAKTNVGPKPTSIRYPISASGRKQKVRTKRRAQTAMIDPLMAFAALKTASSTISSAVKAGKDLASLVGPITRLAKAEADLSFAAEKKGGILGKLTGAEQTAIDAHFRKEEANRIRDEMRELFMLFGSPGQWERLQAEIAAERVRRKKALEAEVQRKRRLKNTVIIVLSLVAAITILTLEIMYLKGAL